MSFFPLAAAAAGAWVYTAATLDWQNAHDAPIENVSQESDEKEPFRGAWGNAKEWFLAQTRGRFVSVAETTDVQGAPIFLVDYGNGQRVVQYHDPRIEL